MSDVSWGEGKVPQQREGASQQKWVIGEAREKSDEKAQRIYFKSSGKDEPLKFIRARRIAQGSIKDVLQPIQGGEWVYYVPRDKIREWFSKAHTREMREEAETRKNILKAIEEKGLDGSNLFLETEVIKEAHDFVERARASDRGSLDDSLKEISFDERKRFGRGLMHGIATMHELRYVHGDLKPDNLLIFGNDVQVSDFGKTKELGPDETAFYAGNIHFAPPEFVTSQKGEVYSAALSLTRIFEDKLLDEDGNLPGPEIGKKKIMGLFTQSKRHSKDLRGILKFIVERREFIAGGLNNPLASCKARFIRLFGLRSKAERKKDAAQIHKYIEKMCDQLLKNEWLDYEQADKLKMVLTSMTNYDPKARPTMAVALDRYNAIFPPIPSEQPWVSAWPRDLQAPPSDTP